MRNIYFPAISRVIAAPVWLAASGMACAQCTQNAWTAADPTPTPRYAHALVADTGRGEVLMFGGLYRVGASPGTTYITNTTWVWNGATGDWARRTSNETPTPRDSPAIAYDPARRRVVLFGGCLADGTEVNDTWEFDGDSGQWTRVFPSVAPSARQGAAMVFDSLSSRIMMFGGWKNGSIPPSDLWDWDGANWTPRAQSNPPSPRGFAAMVPETTPGRFLLFGGLSSQTEMSVSETWRFDSVTDAWTRLTLPQEPGRRFAHALMPDPDRGRIVLFGGFQAGIGLGDTWEWIESAERWIERAPTTVPAPRGYVSGVFDPATRRPVLLGGLLETEYGYNTSSELWQWNGAEGQWRRMSTRVFPPNGSTNWMAHDATRRRTVFWPNSPANGGTIWEWDGVRWRSVSAPQLGSELPMTFDGEKTIAVVPTGTELRTWTWNGSNWTRLANCPASFIYPPLLAYDSRRDRVVLFSQGTRQTWEWDRTGWTLRTTLGPVPRLKSTMAYDPVRGITVLHGGQNVNLTGTYNDTWVWNGDTWTNPTTGPTVAEAEMAFDPDRQRMVLIASSGTYTWTGSGPWLSAPTTQSLFRYRGALVYHDATNQMLLMGGSQPAGPLETSHLVTVVLSCSCYANCDSSTASPILNANDFQCFINRFAAGDESANCDNSTSAPTLNAGDFACFVQAYAAGCP